MKITDEIKLEIKAKKTEIENLQKEEKIKDALKAAGELDKLVDKLKIEEAKEKAAFEHFLKGPKMQVGNTAEDAAKLRTRAFNKLVLNPLRTFPEPLTDEEKNAYFNLSGSPGQPALIESINTKGGYLVPQEQMATLQEIRKEFIALKDYVNVVSTNTTSGTWPVYTQQNLKFQTLTEMTEGAESDLTITQASYTVSDRILILPVSNQLIADSTIDIVSFMGRELADAAVRTENAAIVAPLETLITGDTAASIAEATTITSYKALNTAMFKTLDGVYYNAAKIFTNQDGFLWLANLDDAQNRPLFVPDVTNPNKYFYRGKEIVVIPNSVLPNKTISTKTYAPFFVGDMKSFLTFFERAGLELATSDQVYWKQNGFCIRGIVRFGVVVTDPAATVALKVEL
mgnify:CR=1 FL=1